MESSFINKNLCAKFHSISYNDSLTPYITIVLVFLDFLHFSTRSSEDRKSKIYSVFSFRNIYVSAPDQTFYDFRSWYISGLSEYRQAHSKKDKQWKNIIYFFYAQENAALMDLERPLH